MCTSPSTWPECLTSIGSGRSCLSPLAEKFTLARIVRSFSICQVGLHLLSPILSLCSRHGVFRLRQMQPHVDPASALHSEVIGILSVRALFRFVTRSNSAARSLYKFFLSLPVNVLSIFVVVWFCCSFV